jgi:hypothetical protein
MKLLYKLNRKHCYPLRFLAKRPITNIQKNLLQAWPQDLQQTRMKEKKTLLVNYITKMAPLIHKTMNILKK